MTERPLRRWLGSIDAFVFAAEDARRLAAMRIGLFGLLAVRLAASEEYASVAGQPSALFDPVSLFHLLPSMPSPGLTAVVQVLGAATALLAAAGLWPRLSFTAAFASAVFLGLMVNATGKIVHNDVVLTLCLLPLVASPRAACRAWAVPSKPGSSEEPMVGRAFGWPIRTAMVVVALAYLFVGLQKLRFSGPEWFTSDNLRNVLWASSDAQANPNDLALFVANRDWLAHTLATATIAVEVGFIACLPVPALRWLLVPAAVGLHLGIWLAMGLDYVAQALTVIIVFVNWAAVADFCGKRGWGSRLRPIRRAAR